MPLLRVDPASRAAVMLLPTQTEPTIALLPLFQDALDLTNAGNSGSLPYAPSFIVSLRSTILSNQPISHVRDLCFLPGFNEPTLAILFTPTMTWTARIDMPNQKDNYGLIILTLDFSGASNHAIILDVPSGLPYNSFRLFACPKELGGVIVMSSDMLTHVDQSGKIFSIAVNGWPKKTSNSPNILYISSSLTKLDNCQLVFPSETTALLFNAAGEIYQVKFRRDGRTLSAITLSSGPLGISSPPSTVELVGREFIYVASTIASGVLLRHNLTSLASQPATNGMEVDEDEDVEDDLYAATTRLPAMPLTERSNLSVDTLEISDSIDSYGPIRNMTVGLVSEDVQPELVCCTGGIQSGGLTIFSRGMTPRKKRKLNDSSSVSLHCVNQGSQTLIYMSALDKTQVMTIKDNSHEELREIKEAVLAASAFFKQTAIVEVTSTSLNLSFVDGSRGQSLQIPENPPISKVQIVDPNILIHRSDGSVTIYQGDETVISTRTITFPAQQSHNWTLYSDVHARFAFRSSKELQRPGTSMANGDTSPDEVDFGDDGLYSGSKNKDYGLPGFKGFADHSKQFVLSCSESGKLEIYSLPDRRSVFQNLSLAYLPSVVSDSVEKMEPGAPEEDAEIKQILLTDFGRNHGYPHLVVLLKNDLLAVYEAVPDFTPLRASRLAIRFIKVLVQELISRSAPIQVAPAQYGPDGCKGAFVTGDKPLWLLRTDHGQLQAYNVHEKAVSSFACSSSSTFYSSSEQGTFAAELPTKCCDKGLPWSTVNVDRTYSHVAYDNPSETYVAASIHFPPFELFTEEEGIPVWRADDPSLSEPQPRNFRSAIELLLPSSWEAIHGYEFRSNEMISSMQSVNLESKSTTRGTREFIGIGTTISRGEDLSVRGCIYLFEVVQTVAPEGHPQYCRQLRLRFKEDQKAPVAHINAMNGYFVHSLGLKLYVKALDLDERLLSVGFLDIGAHTTSIQVLKNFIMLGDALRGVTFIAFQETPYKLVSLGKDIRARSTTTADFMVYEGKLAFITSDESGVLRTFEYNPTNLESRGGERLLCRTEFQLPAEVVATLFYSKKIGSEEEAKQSGLLQACADGSLLTIAPCRDAVYRRLQLLERQLQRHAPHFAALNPRAYRNVNNESVSKSLNKGILDGQLLDLFPLLHISRQMEIATSVNSNVETIRFNIKQLKGPW